MVLNIRRRRILVIEDDFESAKALAECLPCFDAETVHRFDIAIHRLVNQGKYPYSAILLDLNLPDKKGADVSLALHNSWPEIPIVVITGMSDTEAPTVVIRRAGAEYVIRKPIDMDELRKVLIDVIATKEAAKDYKPIKQDLKEAKNFMQEAMDSAVTNKPKSDPNKNK